jgi:hypothetical protein
MTRKKIVPYDEETAETIASMQSCGQLLIPRDNFAPMDDLNRLRAQDIIVLMLGYGVKLYHKIAFLAAGQNEGKQASSTRPIPSFRPARRTITPKSKRPMPSINSIVRAASSSTSRRRNSSRCTPPKKISR